MKKNSKFPVLSFVLLIMIGVGFINLSSYANSFDYTTIPPITKTPFPALIVTTAMGSGSPKYEAENAIISGGVVYNDTAASNGKGAERIDKAGKYISFSNVTSGNTLVLGYASMLSGKLSIYKNDVRATELKFTKNGSWKGAYKEVSLSLGITSGNTIKIQYSRGDSALNLDYIKVNGGVAATSALERTTAPAATAMIIIENFSFNPASVTIKHGTQVTWINNDSMIHNIVIGKITSPDLPKGMNWSQTFNQIGTFKYKCGFHASMTGTIVVK